MTQEQEQKPQETIEGKTLEVEKATGADGGGIPSPEQEPQKKPGVIEVKQEVWEGVMKDLERMKKNQEMLIQTTDKKALARYYARNQKDLPKEVKIRTFPIEEKDENGQVKFVRKVILGWRTVQNEVYQEEGSMKWKEIQTIELLFDDGTRKQTSLLDFNRRYEHINCKRIGMTQNEQTGMIVYKLVRLDNGKELEIGAQYVN